MKRNHFKINKLTTEISNTIQAVLNTLLLNNYSHDQILSQSQFGA